MSDEQRLRGVVVSHTHWDREWYLTFQEYRANLVNVMDMLLQIFERNPNFRHFMLDGQISPLEDYLEIRSEAEGVIRQLVSTGKLSIGPWYTQPGSMCVSGESLIRNLLVGHVIAESFGGVMKIGYVPDTFGHPAQLPQILKGFGIDSFLFQRGYSGGDAEFIWEAPDGSQVYARYLALGYGSLHGWGWRPVYGDVWIAPGGWLTTFWEAWHKEVGSDPSLALEQLKKVAERMLKHQKTDFLLLMNGTDHYPPQGDIDKLIEYANRNGFQLIHGSIELYLEHLRALNNLETYRGELWDAGRRPLLYGVQSTRVYLKRMNFWSQTLLEKYVEPISVLCELYGYPYPWRLIWEAWKILLRNHAHDSIYGCSRDEVHRENVSRFIQVLGISSQILSNSLRYLASLVKCDSDFILVFNPHPYRRRDIVSIPLKGFKEENIHLSEVSTNRKVHSWFDGSVEFYSESTPVLKFLAEVPPLGYSIYKIESGSLGQSTSLPYGENYIENEYLKVVCDPERGGVLTLIDKETGVTYNELNFLIDGGDAGDEYDYSPPTSDRVVSSLDFPAEVVTYSNSSMACMNVKLVLSVPEKCIWEGEGSKRSDKLVDLPVEYSITLYSGIKRVDIKLRLLNNAEDHRLQLVFKPGFRISESHAESHFYPCPHPLHPPEDESWIQRHPHTYHMLNWCSLNSPEGGLIISVRGLNEYSPDESSLKITLLRAVGYLSRKDLSSRVGAAGPLIPTPDAQCKGWNSFEYSLIPFRGNLLDHLRNAQDFSAPLIGVTMPKETISKEVFLPPKEGFLELKSNKILLSSLKQAERNRSWYVLRLYNVSEESVETILRIGFQYKEVWISNLNEEPLKKVEGGNGEVKLDFKPYEIVTLMFRDITPKSGS